MVRVEAKKIKAGDKIIIEEIICTVKKVEVSNIGKHGKVKCRIETVDDKGNEKVVIRPSDYEFEKVK